MVTAGWRELVDLPAWGITRLRAKLDTGARTSALHVAAVEETAPGHVTFEVVTSRRSDRRVTVSAPVVRRTTVRSSHGRSTRWVVTTPLRLGPILREIEVTLVDRGKLLHRMLVGRTALVGILVDPSRRYVLTRPRGSPPP